MIVLCICNNFNIFVSNNNGQKFFIMRENEKKHKQKDYGYYLKLSKEFTHYLNYLSYLRKILLNVQR